MVANAEANADEGAKQTGERVWMQMWGQQKIESDCKGRSKCGRGPGRECEFRRREELVQARAKHGRGLGGRQQQQMRDRMQRVQQQTRA